MCDKLQVRKAQSARDTGCVETEDTLRETIKRKLANGWQEADAETIRNEIALLVGANDCQVCGKPDATVQIIFNRSLLLCKRCAKLYRRRENAVKGKI